MVDSPEAILKSNYDANPAISEAVTNILHSSDLTSLSALAHQGGTTREKEPRVKRPMNAFMLYAQVARRKVATKYPNLNYAKLSKTLGKIWQVLPEEERRPFIQEAERLRTQHKLKHPDYKYTPKRLKNKRPLGSSLKKPRYDNSKPEELFNIIQAKCDPTHVVPISPNNGFPIGYNEKLPAYCENPTYTAQATDPFNSATPPAVTCYDSQFQGLDYLGLPARGFNGFDNELPSTPSNDLKCYFPDYTPDQFLDSFGNPNYNYLSANQPLSSFLSSKVEPTSGVTPLNAFGDGLTFSKLMDPIENISSYLEGKTHFPGYLTV